MEYLWIGVAAVGGSFIGTLVGTAAGCIVNQWLMVRSLRKTLRAPMPSEYGRKWR